MRDLQYQNGASGLFCVFSLGFSRTPKMVGEP